MNGEKTPHRPKRSLGQNFLQDRNIARKIVSCLDIRPGDYVVEIGPGPGALTSFLLQSKAAKLLLVEKDAALAAERRKEAEARKEADGPCVEILNIDALTLPFEELPDGFKCIGNLPYNVASPLMWECFSRAKGLARAVFMIQKEVGQRLAAKPGNRDYGALTVWVQSFVSPRLEFIVPPNVFYPRPKVDSAVLSFVPKGEDAFGGDKAALSGVVKACFQMRRKQIGTILKSCDISLSLLEKSNICSSARPEELTLEQFHSMAASGFFSRGH